MAYDLQKGAKLQALKELAAKMKADYATKSSVQEIAERVDGLVAEGGEPNVITAVKVNGTAQTIAADKSVNITVPTKTSQLNNDSTYQTSAEVATAIQAAIATTGHAKFEKVDTVPTAATAEENVLYLVLNSKTNHYDIYALVGNSIELLDDTTVDLSNYTTTDALNALLAKKVDAETGKGLSSNDYTTAEKTKLAGVAEGANNYVHPTYTPKASGLYKITVDATGHVSAVVAVAKSDITALGVPAQDTTYSAATQAAAGLMSAADKTKLDSIEFATDEEVAEMLADVFGA